MEDLSLVRNAVHPGIYFYQTYIQPFGTGYREAARILKVSASTLSRFMKGKTPLSPKLARHIAIATDTSMSYWLEMQMKYDIAQELKETLEELPTPIPPHRVIAPKTTQADPDYEIALESMRRNIHRVGYGMDQSSAAAKASDYALVYQFLPRLMQDVKTESILGHTGEVHTSDAPIHVVVERILNKLFFLQEYRVNPVMYTTRIFAENELHLTNLLEEVLPSHYRSWWNHHICTIDDLCHLCDERLKSAFGNEGAMYELAYLDYCDALVYLVMIFARMELEQIEV